MGSRWSTTIFTAIPTLAQPRETSANTGRLTALRITPNGYDRGSPVSVKGPNRIRRRAARPPDSPTTRSAVMNASNSFRTNRCSAYRRGAYALYSPSKFTILSRQRLPSLRPSFLFLNAMHPWNVAL